MLVKLKTFNLLTDFNKNNVFWTEKYNPIKVIKLINNCEEFDEIKYTLQLMKKFGINNVRSYTFYKIKLSDETQYYLENYF